LPKRNKPRSRVLSKPGVRADVLSTTPLGYAIALSPPAPTKKERMKRGYLEVKASAS